MYRDLISKSTFFKYLNINKQYKKPHRLTDLCDYCEWARNAKSDINIYLKANKEFELKENFEVEKLIQYFDSKKRNISCAEKINEIELLLHKLEKYQIVIEHRNIAKTQRKSYNEQRKKLKIFLSKLILNKKYRSD